jgi:hypothetical protein
MADQISCAPLVTALTTLFGPNRGIPLEMKQKLANMKKYSSAVKRIPFGISIIPILSGVFLVVAPPATQAQYTYTTNADNTLTITRYIWTWAPEVDIPSTINGLSVTVVGEGAFYAFGIPIITIPNTVITIGSQAFRGCTSLASIAIPSSVTNISPDAFSDCTSMTMITVDPQNSHYSSADGVLFDKAKANLIQYPCGKSGDYVIPNTVIDIEDGAFANCGGLTGITIPNSTTNIGSFAFSGCSSLNNVIIPGAVPNISAAAFQECGSLTNATISEGVSNIGDWAFQYCSSLTTVTIPGSVTSIGAGAFANTGLASVIIPASTTNIAEFAFENSGLNSVAILSGSLNLGYTAFAGCVRLINVYFASNAPATDSTAFQSDYYATAYYLGGANGWPSTLGIPTTPAATQDQFVYSANGGDITLFGYSGCCGAVSIPATLNNLPITRIGPGAFFEYTNLTGVSIPAGVTNIESEAFYSCTSLTNVTFQGNAPAANSTAFLEDNAATTYFLPCTTGWSAFFNGLPTRQLGVETQFTYTTNAGAVTIISYNGYCGNLTVPDAIDGFPVVAIGNMAFYSNQTISTVTIPASVATIGAFAFYQSHNLTSVTGLGGVVNIGDAAFAGCSELTNAVIPNGLTNIGMEAFFGTSLTSVIIPNSVHSIGDQAFEDCINLTNAVIAPGLTGIGSHAFYDCINLSQILIPDTVTNIGISAFSGANLMAIPVSPQNQFFSSVNGVLFNKNQTILVQFPSGASGAYTIPDGVTSIVAGAFSDCAGLTSVAIPSTVTGIGSNTFFDCANLSSVTIPYGVTSVGDSAFYQCYSLASVTVPASVTNIGNYSFAYCLIDVFFQGNAPAFASTAFYYDPVSGFPNDLEGTAIYYLTGAAGWDSANPGVPEALWNPSIQIGDGSFGVQNNQFGFNISGTANIPIVVEACTNLAEPMWVPLRTNALVGGVIYFSDPQWTNYPARFYRIISP